jgi:hypothetical protein
MWTVTNNTPYKAAGSWGRDKDGVHEWIVAVKAAYDIRPDGNVVLAEQQVEPLMAPEFNGDEGISSLRYDADLVATKPTTDVIVNGTAYAPNGHPSANFLIEMRIAEMHKVLRVIGDRTWGDGLFDDAPSRPEPVTEVPIVYERAYGGYDHADPDPRKQAIDLRNPVGLGVLADKRNRPGNPLHNFEYPRGRVDKIGPAGFGAIASYWSPRLGYWGTYDEAWDAKRKPLLPDDWSPRSLQCAPADQQSAAYLRGGEAVELVNLTRDGLLRFTLPKVYLAFTTHISGRKEEHRGKLSTVIIEPDLPRVIMVWTTALPCRTDVDYLDKTVVREKRYIA